MAFNKKIKNIMYFCIKLETCVCPEKAEENPSKPLYSHNHHSHHNSRDTPSPYEPSCIFK